MLVKRIISSLRVIRGGGQKLSPPVWPGRTTVFFIVVFPGRWSATTKNAWVLNAPQIRYKILTVSMINPIDFGAVAIPKTEKNSAVTHGSPKTDSGLMWE